MIDISFKGGVKPKGIKLETIRGLVVCAAVFRDYGKRFTVTSLNDGRHMRGSKHYSGEGWDARSRDEAPGYAQWSDDEKRHIAQACRNRLGKDYDVVVESNHFHFEYDPK